LLDTARAAAESRAMSLEFYRVLHMAGLAMLLLGFGGILMPPKDAERPRMAMYLHGAGLAVMVVAGFGTLAKMNQEVMQPWVIAKMVLWLFAGTLPALVRAGTVPRAFGWIVVVALVTCGAWLAIVRPFS
jgi:hypothetical protein